MGFYFHRIPTLVQYLFPRHLWRLPNNENKIYLTFDDGPTSNVTNFVLDTLQEYEAKATFFMLGKQVENHPALLSQIYESNHQIANHGFEHLDGWKVSREDYLENIRRGELALKSINPDASVLYRAPYGHIKSGFTSVQWTVMSGDFDPELSKKKCLQVLKSKTKSGDILVFHDNKKSFEKLQWVLPRYLNYCKAAGFQFGLIPKGGW